MRLSILFAVLAAPALVAAETAATPPFAAAELASAAELRQQALADDSAWQIVEALTTEIGPRLAGSPNDLRAREWVTAKFKALGYDRVYSEPVHFPVWERGFESCHVVTPFPQPLAVTALGGSMGTPEGGVRAEVVRFDSLAALEAAPPGTLKGRIAFVDARMERARDGAGYGAISKIRGGGASIAARHGASAFLLRSAGTDAQARAPHTGMMRYENTPTRIPAAALSNVDADLLARMLERGPVTLKLELGARSGKRDYVGANVIGEITGSTHPEQVVVIGGHLDSWDLGTGAIDDGAGVALTMAAGALIGRLDGQAAPRRTLRVVAFANEEQGLYGGKAYAKARQDDGTLDQHVIAAESDFGAGRIYEIQTRLGPAASPAAHAAFDQMVELLAPLGISRGGKQAHGGPDINALRDAGVPIAGLMQDGTHYFDWHHTANDTLDKIDPEALRQNVAAYAVFAYLAAQFEDSFR